MEPSRYLRSKLTGAAAAAKLLADRREPWRWDLYLLRRALARRGAESEAARRAGLRFERRLGAFPSAVKEYVALLEQHFGRQRALARARELAGREGASAHLIARIAQCHYVRDLFPEGDALIQLAKQVDIAEPRIYIEEAWNQRSRGRMHGEIEAVTRLIELSEDPAERLSWRVWLGEALMRLGRFERAWEQLRRYPEMPADDRRLLSAAYCAAQLGLDEQAHDAYRRFAPLGETGIDVARLARLQLEAFQRPDEAARLLADLDDGAETSCFESSFRASLLCGDPGLALERMRIAADRDDREPRTRGDLAQLLELLERPEEALEVYRSCEARDLTLFLRFRRGALLVERGEVEAAVRGLLDGLAIPDPPEGAGREVDPRLVELLLSGELLTPEQLADAVPRVSDHGLLAPLALRLAAAHAESGEWEAAWRAICAAQDDRLPSVPLTRGRWATPGVRLPLSYYEACAAEPLREDTILYESSLGMTTSCNPLAICLELLRGRGRDMLHVWSITERAEIHPALLGLPNVVFVRKGSHGHYQYLATAKYLVNNSTVEFEFAKRDGQRYLNTWHGVPWKMMGREIRSEPFAYGNISRNLLAADVVLGTDLHTLEVLARDHAVDALAPGAFVRAGYPRNDLAINLPPERRAEIRGALGAADGEALVLFMPTWKGVFGQRDAEVETVLRTARDLSSPGVRVVTRAHHYVSRGFAAEEPPPGAVFAPARFDTNELIGAADALVTDFSSVLFDAAAVGLPVVKLVGDIEAYAQQRGLYFTAEEVPGANAASTAEAASLLAEAIADRAAFAARYAEQTRRFSWPEDGTSARRAIEMLFGEGEPPEDALPGRRDGTALLLSTGGLPPNGITRSVRSLLHALQGSGVDPHLMPGRATLEGADPGTARDMRAYARVLPQVGTMAGTRMECEALHFASGRGFVDFPLARRHLVAERRREARRLFGGARFSAAVEFSGYASRDIALIGYGVPAERRGILFHNEMWKEVRARYPRLRSGMLMLDGMDFIASVSDGVRDYNAETLHDHFGVPREKHITIENTINVEEILALAEAPLDERDREWYASDGVHACVVARLSPEKNHAQLFEALAECRDRLSRPVRITCLGDGPLRLGLEQRIVDLGLADLVRMRGQVAAPQAHLRAAGAMILPSLHEGQPLVLLEALTIGTPAIATETPGSRAVLHDGEFGPLVPISREGLIEALHRVADGDLAGSGRFDAEAFTAHSLRMFLDAIEPRG
ncbi:MAG: CDP-glycerol glycerophosphotransferase family protein [Leucobacter sp.]